MLFSPGFDFKKGYRSGKANTALYWLTHTRHAQQTLTQTERQDTSVFLGGSTATLTANESMRLGSRAVTTFVLGRTPCGKREIKNNEHTGQYSVAN
jgi:hypothetical protein